MALGTPATLDVGLVATRWIGPVHGRARFPHPRAPARGCEYVPSFEGARLDPVRRIRLNMYDIFSIDSLRAAGAGGAEKGAREGRRLGRVGTESVSGSSTRWSSCCTLSPPQDPTQLPLLRLQARTDVAHVLTVLGEGDHSGAFSGHRWRWYDSSRGRAAAGRSSCATADESALHDSMRPTSSMRRGEADPSARRAARHGRGARRSGRRGTSLADSLRGAPFRWSAARCVPAVAALDLQLLPVARIRPAWDHRQRPTTATSTTCARPRSIHCLLGRTNRFFSPAATSTTSPAPTQALRR